MLSMFGGRPSPPADQTVKDGDLIRVGNLTLKVLHTPGHSPGGMCLHVDNAVFTGDTLFVGGVGRTDMPGGSWPLMLQSIKTKILTLPDETIIYPGHNYGHAPSSTVEKERLNNPFLK
jgi:glyoxylase-like metal-dependent hydrolase (beta-lactamase superfamily II)